MRVGRVNKRQTAGHAERPRVTPGYGENWEHRKWVTYRAPFSIAQSK